MRNYSVYYSQKDKSQTEREELKMLYSEFVEGTGCKDNEKNYGGLTTMEERFRKIGQTGGSYVVATFVDTETWETKSLCVRDYDYADCSRDKDDLYYMPIDKEAAELWRKHCGVISEGDTVKVVKGRKVEKGTIAKVVKVYDWKDRYGRVQATYAVFEDGQKTNVNNLIIVA